MKSSIKTISIIDSTMDETELGKLTNFQTEIIAVDYDVHKKLDELKIKHLNLDEFLDKKQRFELYQFTLQNYNWFEKISDYIQFEKNENIEILRFMSPLEFHEFLLSYLIRLFAIKNLISYYSPKKILTTKSIHEFIKILSSDLLVEIVSENEIKEKGFLVDEIELKFNLFSKPLTIYISKNRYNRLKGIYEWILCKKYNLCLKNSKKELIIFLEFNTSLYKTLFEEYKNSEKTVVLLNNRRSALWGKGSREILTKNNIKVMNPEMFFDNETKKLFELKQIRIKNFLKKLWSNEQFSNIFQKEGINFWPLIKNTLEDIFKNRLDDYLKFHLCTENMLSRLNINSIFCLNESGETENIILRNNKNRIPVFLLQHSFLRYSEKNFDSQWLYEDQYMYGLKSRNFLLWGNMDYQFFLKYSNFNSDRLIISGSPRHDQFKDRNLLKKDNKKSVLLTLSPISDRSGNVTINLIERYEKKLKNVINLLQTFDDLKIIVKLHPGENWHNQILLKFLDDFRDISVYLTKSPYELIQNANFMITFTPEIYDSSTIMLDALVLNTPVLQIILDNSVNEFKNDDGPILKFLENDNIDDIIKKCLLDEQFLPNLCTKIPKILDKYLLEHGNACKNISEIIEKF